MARASTAAANDTGDLDQLWSVPPEKFVAARTAAVAALKAAGDAKGAAALKAVKRPTPSAWLVNALVRTAPEHIEELFAAGDGLMKAQGRVLAGADPSEMHAAMKKVRDAVGRAMKRARAILAEHGRTPTADLTRRVTHTLRSASLDRSLRDLVLAGRLTADPSVDEVEALTDVRVPKRVATPKKEPKKKADPKPKGPTAAERRNAERDRARAEREAARAAEREARERLRAEIAEAEGAVEDARRALANAETDERRARSAAADAAKEVARAKKALQAATDKHARAKKRLR